MHFGSFTNTSAFGLLLWLHALERGQRPESYTPVTAPRLERLRVKNLRSIGPAGAQLVLPASGPLVILGENNAGKSNLVRGLDMLFGDRWPGSVQPDDHDFFGRDPDGIEISVSATVSGVVCDKCQTDVTYIGWSFDKSRDIECDFKFRGSCTHTWMSNAIRQQLYCMWIGADRRLSYQLSYASKFTFLSRLMHKFHERLNYDASRVERLRGIFEDLLDQFAEVAEFQRFREVLATAAEDFGQNLSYRLDIDFSAYDPSNFFRSLRVHPKFDEEARSFDELGTGQEQILALAFSYAYARAFGASSGLLLVIDEPESHLHPLAQRWLAQRLTDMATEGLQVVLTTHSPHFVDLAKPENLVVVRKPQSNAATSVTQVDRPDLVTALVATGADPARTTPESVGPFYASSSTPDIISGLFCRAAVLVEGQTEAFALPALLRLVGCDPLREGISFISVGGLGNLAKWRRLFGVFDIPTYVVADTDSDKDGQQAEACLRSRVDLMKALGLPESQASPAVDTAPLTVMPSHAWINPNAEVALGAVVAARWGELIQESRAIVNESKPLQARYAATQLAAEEVPAAAQVTLRTLAEAIRQLVRPPEADAPAPATDEPPF